jgi:DNA-binding MarR family transcriptional regulator
MTSGHEIAKALKFAYLSFHRQADLYLAKGGVTADQFALMTALAEEDAVSQQDLVQRLSSDPNTIRAMLVLLERRGLIARRQHATDRRVRTVSLTAKGRRTYDKLKSSSEPLRTRLMAALERNEASTLLGLLGRVTEAMAAGDHRQAPSKRTSAAPASQRGRATKR